MVAGGSTRLPMATSDGEGNLNLLGEEDGADDVLTDVAAAGDAGHAHGGEHRHQPPPADSIARCMSQAARIAPKTKAIFSTQEKQEPSMCMVAPRGTHHIG